MSPLMTIISLISWLLSLYSFLCLLRVVFTWIPGIQGTKVAYYLNRICDPYLDLFKNLHIFRVGSFDFTPILALGILAIGSNILNSIVLNGSLKLGCIVADILSLAWSVVSSIITFFNIIIALRLVIHLLKKDYSSAVWSQLDKIIYPVKNWLLKFFKGRYFQYTTELIITLAASIIVQTAGSWLTGLIASLLVKLPF